MASPSRPSLQDEAVKRAKTTSKLFLAFLENHKGKTKPAGADENAAGYYNTLDGLLTSLFVKRWERSPLQGKWSNFKAVWNNGQGSWTDSAKSMKIVDEGLRQSE